MRQNVTRLGTLISVLVAAGVLSACSVVGERGTPRQMLEAQAVHAFDENRAPFGQRIATAQAIYSPRVYGLSPYFGR